MAERTNVYEAMIIFDSNRFARERAGLPAEVEKMIKAEQGEVLVSRLVGRTPPGVPDRRAAQRHLLADLLPRPELDAHRRSIASGKSTTASCGTSC